MSLFNQLQWQIIENPKWTYSYHKILREEKEKTKESDEERKKRRKKEWRELADQKKAELSKEEFLKRRQKAWYQWNKEERQEFQLEYVARQKAEQEALLDEIFKEVYDPLPEPINYDKFYTEKFTDDDMNYERRRLFSWRVSRLNWIKPSRQKKYKSPVRIYNPWSLNKMFTSLTNIQDRAYEYMKPHLSEVTIKDFCLNKNQFVTKNPLWSANWRMRELKDATNIPHNQLFNVTSAMLRDKYIASEVYMGRVSFLVGDVIITEAGNVLRPCLENNIPWLTPETVEALHQKRKDWLKCQDELDIYILRDTYLVKYKLNEYERETFYLIPT